MTDVVNLLIGTHFYPLLVCLPVLLWLEALKLYAPASVAGRVGYVAWFPLNRGTKWNLGGESKQHEAAAALESQIFRQSWWLRTCVHPRRLWQASRMCQRCCWQGHIHSMLLLEQPCGVVLLFPSGCFIPAYLISQPCSPTSPEVLRTTQSFFFFLQ